MFDLNDAVEKWAAEAVRKDSRLTEHIDELTDHVLSAAEASIADGVEPSAAFHQAVQQFGEPTAVARQYRNPQAWIAVGLVVGALFWTVLIFIFNEPAWLGAAYWITTFIPLTLLSARYTSRDECAKDMRRKTKSAGG